MKTNFDYYTKEILRSEEAWNPRQVEDTREDKVEHQQHKQYNARCNHWEGPPDEVPWDLETEPAWLARAADAAEG